MAYPEIDIGNRCTHCLRNTAFTSGNGLFVNRIPSDADGHIILGDESIKDVTLVGYMCPDCQMVECDRCGRMALEYNIKDDEIVCVDCG